MTDRKFNYIAGEWLAGESEIDSGRIGIEEYGKISW